MKFGIRTPSIKKSISARTTGKIKRKFKRLTVPFYGRKGVGFIRDPIKSLKGKIYRKTTISAKSATNFIVQLTILPFYFMLYCFLFTWYIAKYAVIAIVWLVVKLINLCIAFVEWIINLFEKHKNTNLNKLP